MALQANTDNGVSRLVGDDSSESIVLTVGQLAEYPGGLWTLGGSDTVTGSTDSEWVASNLGEDSLSGGGGNDTLMGGKDPDRIDGEIGNDFLRGDLDADTVSGGSGNDSLFGGKGNDQLVGNAGDDFLNGDRDRDTLSGGDGLDTLTGGTEGDVFVLATGQGSDIITDFEVGIDFIQLPDALSFNSIRLQSSTNGQNTLILDSVTGQQLAQVNNVRSTSLTSANFIAQGTPTNESSFEARVVELTNNFRAQNGLPPLTVNVQLTATAETHSQNMAVQDFFSHTGLNGSQPSDRVKASGYNYTFVGENIGAGYSTPEEAVQGWLNSPGHRANILNPNYQEIGIGYYYLENDTGNENWNHYWTQVFGRS